MRLGAPDSSGGAVPRRVLVIDDDGDFAESLADVLELHGFTVMTAGSGDAAREVLQKFGAQVVLVDLRLGLTSGAQLIRALKDEHAALTFIMMTAHADIGSAIEAMRGGAYDYLIKSTDPREPVAALERCFEKLQLQRDYKAAYEELLVAKEAAEAASRAKSQFLATMSHELRTPLNAIIGFSELLMLDDMRPSDPGQIGNYAKAINESGHHLLEVINDILDLSKAEAGKLELSEAVVGVPEILAAVERVIQPRAASGGLVVRVAPVEELHLRADARILRQILLNLVSNSIKFTPRGGEVVIGATLERDGLAISVADTGIGMAAEDIPRAFEPFRQIDNRISRKYEGTGLGLPLVKAMADAHQASVEVESKPGAGTRVRIVFPPARIVQSEEVKVRAAG